VGPEFASWFQDLDSETIMWMIILSVMLMLVGGGLLYWDHVMRKHEEPVHPLDSPGERR